MRCLFREKTSFNKNRDPLLFSQSAQFLYTDILNPHIAFSLMYFGRSGDISLGGVSLEVCSNFLWVKGIVSVVQRCEYDT